MTKDSDRVLKGQESWITWYMGILAGKEPKNHEKWLVFSNPQCGDVFCLPIYKWLSFMVNYM